MKDFFKDLMRHAVHEYIRDWERDDQGQCHAAIVEGKGQEEKALWIVLNCKGRFFYLDPSVFDREYNGGKSIDEINKDHAPGSLRITLPVIVKEIWLFEFAEDAVKFKLTFGGQ